MRKFEHGQTNQPKNYHIVCKMLTSWLKLSCLNITKYFWCQTILWLFHIDAYIIDVFGELQPIWSIRLESILHSKPWKDWNFYNITLKHWNICDKKTKKKTHTELLNIIHLEARRGQVIYSMYSTPEVRLFCFLCWSSTILSWPLPKAVGSLPVS